MENLEQESPSFLNYWVYLEFKGQNIVAIQKQESDSYLLSGMKIQWACLDLTQSLRPTYFPGLLSWRKKEDSAVKMPPKFPK